jgi:hypothetical protein
MAIGGRPDLATWAEVDPARYPFDPAGVPMLVPSPPPRGSEEALTWVHAVGAALSERYGPWAYRWDWTPGEWDRLGWITNRIPPPDEAPAFVADVLLVWRRWLENLAERFDRLLPLPDPAPGARSGDVEAWEIAVAQVVRTVVATVADDGGWQGWCRRVLQWLLTAAGIPVDRAEVLADGAIDKRFEDWHPPTTAVVDEVAERLTRNLFGLAGTIPDTRWDDWPQT